MKRFFAQLSQRERQLLLYGGGVILLVLLWLLVYQPLSNRINRQVVLKNQLQQQLTGMQQAAATIKGHSLRPQQVLPIDQTFSSWLDAQLNKLNMQQSVKRSEPIDENTVTLWLESVPFDPWADWLQQINRQYGVVVEQADIQVTDRTQGLVNIRMRITKS